MKHIFLILLFIFSVDGLAQTGIGTTSPNPSAKLDVYATDKGFLPPRVNLTSATDAATIASPAVGLLVYNMGSAGLQAGYYYWNGSSWSTIATTVSPDQSVDYIQASLSANQTLSSAGNINFNTSSGTGITLTSGGFNLIANKTYKLEAALGGTSGAYAYYGWVDNANTLLSGGSIGTVMKAGSAFSDAPQDKAVVFYTPTSNSTVYLRVLTVSGGVTAYAPNAGSSYSSTWATIQQVGSSAIVNPWVLSGNNVYNTSGNVGIGTNAPHSSAILDISSTTKGFVIPRMTSAQRSLIGSPTNGLQVFDTTTNSTWYFDGTSWVNSVSVASIGDIKTGFQTGDHNGWIKLDGRSKLSLSASQQTQATLLGITNNLPNADNSVLMQTSSGTLGTVSGSNTRIISQANLPNVNFTGTTSSNGDHAHTSAFSTSSMSFSWGVGGGGGAGYNIPGSPSTSTNGAHIHTVSVASGGSGTALDITPQVLKVNTFIYLGY